MMRMSESASASSAAIWVPRGVSTKETRERDQAAPLRHETTRDAETPPRLHTRAPGSIVLTLSRAPANAS